VVNGDGTLTVYYSDGTTYTSPSLKGADGQDGKDGQDGHDGQDGAPGQDGQPGRDGAPGRDGVDGVTPNITATATVDNTPGVANVTVTKSGTDANPIFAFNFEHLKGDQGTQGLPGKDGVSPTAYVTQTGTNEVTITVIDANGTTTGVLTGQAGAPGQDGAPGRDGVDGKDGAPGQDGAPGRDGVDGKDGAPGQDGKDGVSPLVTVADITGGHRVTISDADGTQSFDVMDGAPGQNGTNGTTPVITVTASQNGTPITVTKTGTDEAPNFDFALTGGGGGSTKEILLHNNNVQWGDVDEILEANKGSVVFIAGTFGDITPLEADTLCQSISFWSNDGPTKRTKTIYNNSVVFKDDGTVTTSISTSTGAIQLIPGFYLITDPGSDNTGGGLKLLSAGDYYNSIRNANSNNLYIDSLDRSAYITFISPRIFTTPESNSFTTGYKIPSTGSERIGRTDLLNGEYGVSSDFYVSIIKII